ncbi:MAG: PspC domain-containing protein [Prevotella sp.]|jgi:phage shock protein C
MEQKKFYLSNTDKKIAGVCGGIAEYFEIDSLLVRVAFLLFIFGLGGGLMAYIILWLLAPRKNDITL